MEDILTAVKEGKEAVIVRLFGGHRFQIRLRTMGIREGKVIKVVSRHPFGGPLVVEVDGREATIGRGMAGKIIVEMKI
jgi:ferrous iron transport protein A